MTNRFENLIIIGRPGSGKSEVVDLLRKTPLPKRILFYHVGDFIEQDDFVWLSEKFKEDDIWEEMGAPRKHSKRAEDSYVILDDFLWDFAIEMLAEEVHEKYLSDSKFYDQNTIFIEFSRGGKKTYRGTLDLLTDEILSKSVILHLDITFEEALMRNQMRYKEGHEDTKLHHRVALEEMNNSYSTSDWLDLSFGRDNGYINIRENRIPFVSIRNHPAPQNDMELEKRVASAFHTLFNMKYGASPYQEKLPENISGGKSPTFDHLFVFGRPASGKSEFIDFMKNTQTIRRVTDYHIGYFEEIDDYAMLAEKFREDDIWKKVTGNAKYTTMENDVHVVRDLSLYNFAANRINNMVMKRYLPNEEFYDEKTLFIEFSRGGEIGYKPTLDLLDPDILRRGAIFYVKTPFDECWRRNVARYEEKKKYSVLAHMVPREQMEKHYLNDDWDDLTKAEEAGFITINGVDIPFATMDNEIESKDPAVLHKRYKNSLNRLHEIYQEKQRQKVPLKTDHFNNLFIFGRPASGKSEFIDFIKKCDDVKRRRKFFISPFEIFDDYLSLADLSENEEILEKLSRPRQITETTSDGIVVTDAVFFDFASQKIARILTKKSKTEPNYYDKGTRLIEFSRGIDNNGYERSLTQFKPEFLSNGAIIYIKVGYEEALRRNEARYKDKLKYSVLAHKVPEKAMEAFYQEDDWERLTSGADVGFVEIEGTEIPFVTLNNEPESKDVSVMEKRYEEALQKLFVLWKEKQGAN